MQIWRASARDRLRVLAVHREVLRPVDLARGQALGELDAQARQRRLGLDLVLEDAEAVLGHQRVVGLAHLRVLDQGEARLQCVDGRAPVGAPLEGLVQHHQRDGLGCRRLRALVGGQRGAGSVDRQLVALAALVGLDGEQRAGKAGPAVHVIGVGHHGLRVGAGGGPGIVAGGQHSIALRLELAGAALGLPVGLQVGLVALGVAGDAGVREAEAGPPGPWPGSG